MKSVAENQYYSFNSNQAAMGIYSYPPPQHHPPYEDSTALFNTSNIYSPTVSGQELLNSDQHQQQRHPTSGIGYHEQYTNMNKLPTTAEISAENEPTKSAGKKSRKNKSKTHTNEKLPFLIYTNYFILQ